MPGKDLLRTAHSTGGMVDVIALVLRMIHITFAVVWIGAVAFSVGVLRVIMPRVAMDARKQVLRQLIPTVIHYVPLSAAMTILFGAILYLYMGSFNPTILVETLWGLLLLTSLVLTLATFAYGMTVGVGTSRSILGHLKEKVCEHADEMGRLQKRFNMAQVVVLVLGIIILGMMVFATAG